MQTNTKTFSEVMKHSFNQAWGEIIQFLPTLLVAIIILLFGYIIAKLLSKLVNRILTKLSNSKWLNKKKGNKPLFSNDFKSDSLSIISLVSKFTYWVIMLFFLVVTSELLGWEIVSKEIGTLFRYIPKLLSGIIIVIIGMYIARFVKHSLANVMRSLTMSGEKVISGIAFYIVMIFVVITALNQIGINTLIINQNITIIIGAILISFAIAFGFASRNVLESFISGTYNRNNLELGMHVRINNKEGVIEKIDNVSITISNDEIEHVIPLKKLSEEDYDIIKKTI